MDNKLSLYSHLLSYNFHDLSDGAKQVNRRNRQICQSSAKNIVRIASKVSQRVPAPRDRVGCVVPGVHYKVSKYPQFLPFLIRALGSAIRLISPEHHE